MAVRVKDRIEANIRQSDKVNNSLSINGKTFNGSTTVNVGVIGAAYGGTGQTTLVNSANALINALGIGTSTPIDQDYYISQTVGGGTTSTIYNRRPHSALYTYIKNKASGTWNISVSGSANSAYQLNYYSTAGEYTKHTLAYFNEAIGNDGTAKVGVNDGPLNTNTWWHFLRFTHANSSGYYTDLAIPFGANSLYYKRINSGSVINSTINAGWIKVLDELNYDIIMDSRYLKLLGGTLSGSLVLKDGANLHLRASASSPTDSGDIIFENNDGTENMRIYGSGYIRFASDGLSYKIVHSGNYESYLPSRLQYQTGNVTSDINSIPDSGFYYTATSGVPNVYDANVLSIAHSSSAWRHQLLFKFNGAGVSGAAYDGADIYTRIYNNSNRAWGVWHVLLSSGNYAAYCVPKTGGTFTGEVIGTSANAFRLVHGNYGMILRNDGDSFWMLPTAAGDPYGGWAITAVRIPLATGVLHGAAWNDYAEFRTTAIAKAGEVVIENGDGTMHRSYKRLEPAANIVSDTYGFAIGETEKCGTPIAVAGRVLAYPYEDRYSYKAGDAVCSAPDGKVSKMSLSEMVMYPNCIIGYVSEIPEYEVWGQTDVPVNGRIWIKV